jgi:hypothetical protein
LRTCVGLPPLRARLTEYRSWSFWPHLPRSHPHLPRIFAEELRMRGARLLRTHARGRPRCVLWLRWRLGTADLSGRTCCHMLRPRKDLMWLRSADLADRLGISVGTSAGAANTSASVPHGVDYVSADRSSLGSGSRLGSMPYSNAHLGLRPPLYYRLLCSGVCAPRRALCTCAAHGFV